MEVNEAGLFAFYCVLEILSWCESVRKSVPRWFLKYKTRSNAVLPIVLSYIFCIENEILMGTKMQFNGNWFPLR